VNLGLVAIVKDEAPRLPVTLGAIRDRLTHWVIVDTGSTDGTQDVIRETLAGIPGELYEEPFVDFGSARSRAFAHACGTAEWLLAMDADMTFTLDPTWEPDPDVAAYMVQMGSGDFGYRLPLLLRGDREWVSRGPVHEYTLLADGTLGRREPTDAITVTFPDRSSPEKTRWQASLLEAADQDDPRTVFYLAQCYREMGDPRAYGLYRRRVAMGGWEEERFYAAYRAALLEEHRPTRLAALLDAWELRPARLEPLHDAIELLNLEVGNHHAAYALACVVPAFPDPSGDALFQHRTVWTWGMAFQRSIAAWWCGEREEAAALNEALLAMPDLPDNIRAAVVRNSHL